MQNKLWLTTLEIAKRWGMNKATILDYIMDTDLKPFYPNFEPMDKDYLLKAAASNYSHTFPRWPGLKDVIFEEVNVMAIEEEYGIVPYESEKELNHKERRELGQLRREKEKWDESINAAILATQYCLKQDASITKKLLWEELEKKGYGDIPDTVFERIWKALPSGFRSGGGRPKKK